MKLYIRNMVSNRCKMVVSEVLRNMDLHFHIFMGEADIRENISADQRNRIREALRYSGLELIDDRKVKMVEKIKNIIIEMIHFTNELPKTNFSDYLASKMNLEYTSMARTFSDKEGTTIEKFIIAHKIERVKELISYNEYNLTEIAWMMHYSSVAHLSNQFKKSAGFSPSHYKNLKIRKRLALENL